MKHLSEYEKLLAAAKSPSEETIRKIMALGRPREDAIEIARVQNRRRAQAYFDAHRNAITKEEGDAAALADSVERTIEDAGIDELESGGFKKTAQLARIKQEGGSGIRARIFERANRFELRREAEAYAKAGSERESSDDETAALMFDKLPKSIREAIDEKANGDPKKRKHFVDTFRTAGLIESPVDTARRLREEEEQRRESDNDESDEREPEDEDSLDDTDDAAE